MIIRLLIKSPSYDSNYDRATRSFHSRTTGINRFLIELGRSVMYKINEFFDGNQYDFSKSMLNIA